MQIRISDEAYSPGATSSLGAGRSRLALGARAMRPAAPPRKAFATTAAFQAGLAASRGTIHLRLCAGDEGGQAIDAAGVGNDGLRLVQRQRLRLILRLRTMVAFAMFARLLVVALIGLLVAADDQRW